MTKRFIPVLAACLFLMVGTAQAATSPGVPAATTVPPTSPPSGPRTMRLSAVLMT